MSDYSSDDGKDIIQQPEPKVDTLEPIETTPGETTTVLSKNGDAGNISE